MDFISQFGKPPKEFSPAAFWFWYGELEPRRLEQQIDEMVGKGVFNAFMHARAYLKTPYLEKDWWEAVEACVRRGKQAGFFPWLYDEYAWPSGTAGSTFEYGSQKPSRVLALGRQNMAKRLFAAPCSQKDPPKEGALAVFALRGSGDALEILPLHDIRSLPEEDSAEAFYVEAVPDLPDYLNPETIRSFLRFTHEEYRSRFGKEFGGTIPGIFFDEIYMTRQPMPWTERFPQEFLARRGYDLIPLLPLLSQDGGKRGRRVRQDYFKTVSELYEEAFFQQVSEWCGGSGLQLTGHTEELLLEHPCRQGDYFASMRHLQIPGADCHDYRYRFPRKITCCESKYAVSVSRLYRKKRCMSEAMGGAGWGCSLQQYRRGINALAAMGISMFVLHGFSYECRTQGEQGDWPASFFYQNPYWKYFGNFSRYVSRVSFMNTVGNPVVDVGLYYPISQMWAETVNGRPSEKAKRISAAFHAVLNDLIEHQIDTDMIDRDSLKNAELKEGRLCAGSERFRAVLFPDAEDEFGPMSERIAEIRQAGVTVLFYPTETKNLHPAELRRKLAETVTPDVTVCSGSTANLYVSHRKEKEKDFYFIANVAGEPRSVTLRLRCTGQPVGLDPETGEKFPVRLVSSADNRTEVILELQADQAVYLLFGEKPLPRFRLEERARIAPAGRWSFLPAESTDDTVRKDAEKAELEIPLASFSSELHPDARLIRICNTENEKGRCGRHLSLWSASFITRRPCWYDDCRETDLYFRKTLFLPEKPQKAPVCFAAVSDCEIFVNGLKQTAVHSAGEPYSIDLAAALCAGKNLIAVHVHNSTPMHDISALTLEEPRRDRLIALIFEGEATTSCGSFKIRSDAGWIVSARECAGWADPDVPLEDGAEQADACAFRSMGDGFGETEWLFAWEMGNLPLRPWGDLPLFGKTVSYPAALCYGITLPAGTAAVSPPEVKGNFSCRLDGFPAACTGSPLSLRPDGRTHLLQIFVSASGPEDGLQKPVKATVEPLRAPLGDWRLHGLEWFSGSAVYRNTFRVPQKNGEFFLDLGQVNFYAEVWVNGKSAGVRIWPPYRLRVTDLLHEGENSVTVAVSNSAAVERRHMLVDEGMALGWNRYWNEDNIDREGENLVSGLLGPAELIRMTRQEEP
jgi:hypothetical protein